MIFHFDDQIVCQECDDSVSFDDQIVCVYVRSVMMVSHFDDHIVCLCQEFNNDISC